MRDMAGTRVFGRGLVLMLACFFFGQPGARAAQMTLATEVPLVVRSGAAAYVGAAPAGEMLHLVVSLPLRNAGGLDEFLAGLYDPRSSQFRRYLSVDAFAGRFGAAAGDYEKAVAFFAGQGLTAGSSANRMIIILDGKVSDIERVFHVRMGNYRLSGHSFFSADRAPSIDLAVPVLQVLGLDDFVTPSARYVRGQVRDAGGSGPGGQFTGKDMRKIYYPLGKLTGKGQSVGLMELGSYYSGDIRTYFDNHYGQIGKVAIEAIRTDGTPVSCAAGCDDTEQALDIEYVISMAPELASVRVYVGKSAEDVLNRMATDNISKVLSTSWGWNENYATDDALFKEFAAQGQTLLTASGDFSSLAASGPWPEEDGNIVAVGGTFVTVQGPGEVWDGETGWSSSAGGPALDKRFTIPAYQLPFITTPGRGSKTRRNVPDLAANAEPDMVVCASGVCQGGWGGTSFAAPIWAGVIALANQQAAEFGKPVVGFINPAIYGMARAYPFMFHDEVSGVSGLYRCMKSYDLVTGLGSPQVETVIDALTE